MFYRKVAECKFLKAYTPATHNEAARRKKKLSAIHFAINLNLIKDLFAVQIETEEVRGVICSAIIRGSVFEYEH